MDVHYVKYSIDRKKQFQLKTQIVEFEGKKLVKKEALYSEGKKHIETLYQNYELLKDRNNKLFYSKPVLNDYSICFQFEEGVSLDYLMYDCIKNKQLEGLFNYITLYKSHLENEEKTSFQLTETFRCVYGEQSGLSNEPSLLVTNVDLSFENLILDVHQNFKVIDYEWVFVFPIPLEYVFYRVLRNFYLKYNDQISRMISFDSILEHYGVHASKADTYLQMEYSFRSFVGYEWTKLSERYSQKKTKLTDLIKASQKE